MRVIGLSVVILFLIVVGAGFAYSSIESALIEKQFPALGEFADVGGVRMHYVDLPADDPDAPVIVFIHGASGNLRDPLLAFRPRLVGKFRLIFVDRPGHGYSSRGPNDASSPAVQAQIIHQLITNLGIDRAVVVGHSWGAAVAAAYAVQFKTETAGLMLLAPATNPWPGGVDWYYSVATTPIIGTLFTHTLVMPIGQMKLPAGFESVFAPTPVPATYAADSGIALVLRPGEFLANAEDIIHLKANVTEMAPRYREITAPTVIIAGRYDKVVRNDLHAEVIARDIAGSKLVMLENAGHMPQFSAPDVVIDALTTLANGARTHGFAEIHDVPAFTQRYL
jgi:pimeloyl-ACP methyl ester carboxylesterase